MLLREETFRLEAAIRVLHRTVFGREEESQLVDALRKDGLITASVVAEQEGQVVGHALFSDLRIVTPSGTMLAAALAPVGVLAEWRGQGIGTALIQEGMDLCQKRGKSAVIVLGDPKFYTRVGFSSELARHLRSPYSHAGAAWMAAELTAGALRNVYGLVKYPEPFRALDAG